MASEEEAKQLVQDRSAEPASGDDLYRITEVRNEEVLYRRVLPGMTREEGGVVRLLSSAFSDRSFRPSVDRHELCAHLGGPEWTQNGADNGVFEFEAVAARIAQPRQTGNKGEVDQVFTTDVTHKPIRNEPPERDNPAHSEIHVDPPCSRSFFHKITILLAGMAGTFRILPKDRRS